MMVEAAGEYPGLVRYLPDGGRGHPLGRDQGTPRRELLTRPEEPAAAVQEEGDGRRGGAGRQVEVELQFAVGSLGEGDG